MKRFVQIAVLALSALASNNQAQTVDKKTLALDGANRVIAAALAEA